MNTTTNLLLLQKKGGNGKEKNTYRVRRIYRNLPIEVAKALENDFAGMNSNYRMETEDDVFLYQKEVMVG